MPRTTEQILEEIARHTSASAEYLGREAQKRDERQRDGDGGDSDAGFGKNSKSLKKAFVSLAESSKRLKEANIQQASIQKRLLKASDDVSKSLDKANDENRKYADSQNQLIRSTSDAMAAMKARVANDTKAGMDNIERFKILDQALKDVSVAHRDQTKESTAASRALSRLSKTLGKAADKGESLSAITSQQSPAMADFRDTLQGLNMETSNLESAFRVAGDDIDAIEDIMRAATLGLNDSVAEYPRIRDELVAHIKAMKTIHDEKENHDKAQLKITEEHNKIVEKERAKSVENIKKWGGAIATAAVGLERTLGAGLGAGFEQPILSTEHGQLLFESAAMGMSGEDAQAFLASNRDMFTFLLNQNSANKNLMLSAGEGIQEANKFGNVVRDTFGTLGQQKMKMVGEGLSSLVGMGIAPTLTNFELLNQGIEDMAKTSTLTAGELYAAFGELGEDENFTGFMASLSVGTDSATFLTKSFEKLHKATGLNSKEFIKYSKYLADDRNRGAADRIVQGQFTQDLALMLGFSEEEAELLAIAKTSIESITDPLRLEKAQALQIKMEERAGIALNKAQARVLIDPSELQSLKVYMEGANQQVRYGTEARRQAELIAAQDKVNQDRLDASKLDTDPALVETRQAADVWKGITESPAGSLADLLGMLTAASIAGGLAGYTTKIAPGVLAKLIPALKGGLMRGGLLGVGLGVTRAISGVEDGGEAFQSADSYMDIAEFTALGFAVGGPWGALVGLAAGLTNEGLEAYLGAKAYNEAVAGLTSVFSTDWWSKKWQEYDEEVKGNRERRLAERKERWGDHSAPLTEADKKLDEITERFASSRELVEAERIKAEKDGTQADKDKIEMVQKQIDLAETAAKELVEIKNQKPPEKALLVPNTGVNTGAMKTKSELN